MRVIAGTARGARLEAPKGMRVRPTLDRVRESLFNILTPRLPGCRFLDLFAGAGGNGIEALSRGAAAAVFADNDRRSLAAIERNLKHTGLAQHAEVVRCTLPGGLRSLASNAEPFDVVFADPPYDFREYAALLEAVADAKLLNEGGVLVVEHERHAALPEETGGLKCSRHKSYGGTNLSFYT